MQNYRNEPNRLQNEKVEVDRIKESSTSQAIKLADWFSYNNYRVTAGISAGFAVMLSKIKSGNAVRFNYYDGTNTNGDSYQDFLSLLVHKQSEHYPLFLLLKTRKFP